MLQKFHAIWGGDLVATHKGEPTSYEVMEALVNNSHMQLPDVEPADHPPLHEPFITLEHKLATLGDTSREYARAVIYAALGGPVPAFAHGRMVVETPRVVHSEALELCGYAGTVGYVFDQAPGYLVWLTFYGALSGRGFSVYACPSQTLVVLDSARVYARALAWATAIYGHHSDGVLDMVQALLDNDARLLHRIHSVFADAPPLWSRRAYYKLLPCLVDVLWDEPPGVVLGALCPHVPRPDYCDLPEDADFSHPAHGYMAAADSSRTTEWRKRVVRALALPTTSEAPGCTLPVRASDVRDRFPTYTKATEAVRFVRKYALRDLDGFPVLVPDNSTLEGDVRALNRAVSTPRLKPRAKHRLPTMKISKNLRTLLQKMKDV